MYAADISGMGDPANIPDRTLAARFASPIKRGTSRLKRDTKRVLSSPMQALHSIQPSLNPSSSTACIKNEGDEHTDWIDNQITAAIGNPLKMDYEVHELFSEDTGETTTQDKSMDVNTGEVDDNRGDNSVRTCEVNTLVDVALTARIEMLEAENRRLHNPWILQSLNLAYKLNILHMMINW